MKFSATKLVELEQSEGARWQSWLAIALSLGLHGLLLLIWRFEDTPSPASPPTAIAIKLIPDLSTPEPGRLPVPPVEINQQPATPALLSETRPAMPGSGETPPIKDFNPAPAIEPVEFVELPRVAETAVAPEAANPIPRYPALESIRNAVHTTLNEKWRRPECRALEEESAWRACQPDSFSEPPAVSLADALDTYASLHPLREVSSAERNLSAIAANMDRLAASMQQQGIVDAAARQLLDPIESAITLYSANREDPMFRQQRLMADKSGIARRAEQLLNDPWILNRKLRRAQRQAL